MSFRPAWGCLVLALGSSGCSERIQSEQVEREPASFEELCGKAGPVQLLAFDAPMAEVRDLGSFGDRRMFLIRERDLDTRDPIEGPNSGTPRLWSTGPCGEDPIEYELGLGHNDRLWHLDELPSALLRCDLDGSVSAIDPSGVHEPRVLFEVDTCHLIARATPQGLVSLGDLTQDSAALELWPWPTDPWTEDPEATVLHPAIVADSLRVTAAGAFVRTPELELLRFELDGAQAIPSAQLLAEEVVDLDAGSGDRYLLWQGVGEGELGPLALDDVQLGERHELGEGDLSDYRLYARDASAQGFILQHPGEDEQVYRVHALPSLAVESVDLGSVTSLSVADDGGFWASVIAKENIWRYDLATGEVILKFEGRLVAGQIAEDGSWRSAFNSSPKLSDDESELWRLSTDGAIELVAERATHKHEFTDDGRPYTILDRDVDGSWSGTLVVVEPVELREQIIDTGVIDIADPAWLPRTRDLVYLVDEGERRGLWTVRLR